MKIAAVFCPFDCAHALSARALQQYMLSHSCWSEIIGSFFFDRGNVEGANSMLLSHLKFVQSLRLFLLCLLHVVFLR